MRGCQAARRPQKRGIGGIRTAERPRVGTSGRLATVLARGMGLSRAAASVWPVANVQPPPPGSHRRPVNRPVARPATGVSTRCCRSRRWCQYRWCARLAAVWRRSCGVRPVRPAAATAGSQTRRCQFLSRDGAPSREQNSRSAGVFPAISSASSSARNGGIGTSRVWWLFGVDHLFPADLRH